MLTKKKQGQLSMLLTTACLTALLTACNQSGPDALLEGKRLLDRGQAALASRKLQQATSLMPTNVLAWAYLGLAFHQNGEPQEAYQAYSRALEFNPAISHVRFNLGCLLMEQRQWADALEQYEAAVVLDSQSASLWRGIGEAQVRLGESSQAVQSLNNAIRLNPKDTDAWNWLGLAQTQLGNYAAAEQAFRSALGIQANHGPSLRNLAVLTQQRLKNPQGALELYQQYLAFFPTAPNSAEIKNLVSGLEQEIAAAQKPIQIASASEPKTEKLLSSAPAKTNSITSESISNAAPPRPTPPPKPVETRTQTDSPKPKPAVKTEFVKVEEPAVVQPGPEKPVASVRQPPVSSEPKIQTDPADSPESSSEDQSVEKKRGFFAKINPLNLFKKNAPKTTPLPERSRDSDGDDGNRNTVQSNTSSYATRPPQVVRVNGQFQRYDYDTIRGLPAGNRERAMGYFRDAEVARKRNKISEAIDLYAAAVNEDLSFYEAQFNLGLLSYESGRVNRALTAFQAATILRPDSVPARYNFALALKSAGYPVDSANELLALVERDPEDARAHLTLGNLFATTLGDKTRAREHYRRVLELNPGHPEASSIHFWLVENPQ